MSRFAAAMALVLVASPASAERASKPRIMLLDIPPDQAFSPNTAKALNDFLAGAITDQGFEVITSQDMVAVIGLEREKQLLGCGESSCLAEITGAMGADYIVRGNVAVLDTHTALTLALVDAKGRPTSSKRMLVAGRSSSALIQALELLVPDLVRPIRPVTSSPSLARAPTPPTSALPAAGGLASSASASASSATGGSRGAAYGLMGAGTAGLLVSAGAGLLSFLSYKGYYSDAAMGKQSSLMSDQRAANLEAGVAWGGLAVGLVAAGVGTYLLMSGSAPTPVGAHQ